MTLWPCASWPNISTLDSKTLIQKSFDLFRCNFANLNCAVLSQDSNLWGFSDLGVNFLRSLLGKFWHTWPTDQQTAKTAFCRDAYSCWWSVTKSIWWLANCLLLLIAQGSCLRVLILETFFTVNAGPTIKPCRTDLVSSKSVLWTIVWI